MAEELKDEPNKSDLNRNPDGTFAVGNPGGPGRRPGKTLKEFAKEYYELKTDEEKRAYLEKLEDKRPGFVWEMAEGKAKQDNKVEVDIPQTLIELIKHANSAGSEELSGKV